MGVVVDSLRNTAGSRRSAQRELFPRYYGD